MFTRETMRAVIQEALPEPDMANVEKTTRDCPVAQALHRDVLALMDAGEHSVGGVWRRERLSCPGREQLGSYLLNAGDAELWQYIDFHLKTICCEWCLANLDDLRRQQQAQDKASIKRRKQIFASSAGLLPEARRKR
jgi:hypothetical protein